MPDIKEIYAYVAEESGPGDEGVVAMYTGTGWMPMVVAEKELVAQLRPVAERIARQLSKRIKLVRFTAREELESIDGGIVVSEQN